MDESGTTGADGRSRSIPLNQIVAAAQTCASGLVLPDSLIFPLHEKDSFHAWFKDPSHGADRDDWRVVAIDPSSARPLSDRQWGSFFVSFIYELHQGLFLGKVGESFVGILAVFLLLSIATGLYLWWPASGKMRRALSFQGGGSPIRRQYDLHKLSGLGSALVLSLLAATGFYLEFPDAVISTVRWVSPVRDTSPQAEPHSDLRDGAAAILPDQAVAIARDRLPDARVMWLGLPHDARDTFRSRTPATGERSVRREGKAKSGSINTAARSCGCRTGSTSPVGKCFSPGSSRFTTAKRSA
ncbi:MAG: PepSY domain-containing protein [Nitrospira sp.]|nr:PepSY domain-containing protein [Nitrospira sp.]